MSNFLHVWGKIAGRRQHSVGGETWHLIGLFFQFCGSVGLPESDFQLWRLIVCAVDANLLCFLDVSCCNFCVTWMLFYSFLVRYQVLLSCFTILSNFALRFFSVDCAVEVLLHAWIILHCSGVCTGSSLLLIFGGYPLFFMLIQFLVH